MGHTVCWLQQLSRSRTSPSGTGGFPRTIRGSRHRPKIHRIGFSGTETIQCLEAAAHFQIGISFLRRSPEEVRAGIVPVTSPQRLVDRPRFTSRTASPPHATRVVSHEGVVKTCFGVLSDDANGSTTRTPSNTCPSCKSSVNRIWHVLACAAATMSESHHEI